MTKTKQEIFKLLLDLHKILLEEQKAEYEKEHGTILNANQYFQLVVSHEDFDWLRKLSALIASFDEALESDNQDISNLTIELVSLLTDKDNNEFHSKLKAILTHNKNILELIETIINALKNPA